MREILLVDDSPADVTLAREALATRAQNHITSLMDGEAAISFLRDAKTDREVHLPDLMILDLNLPKKDGRTILAEVKADPGLRGIPIVIFSTSQSKLDVTRSYELGANCYVTKPLNLQGFFEAVQSIEEFWFECATLPRGCQ